MAIRFNCSASSCGNRVVYGRKSSLPVFEIKAGEIQLVEVDFCDGCSPCADASALIASTVAPTFEVDVLGTGSISVSEKEVSGCVQTLIVDATAATPGSRYTVRSIVNMDDCRRLSECFKVKIGGECADDGACDTQPADCNKLLGQESICLEGEAAQLTPPAGTVRAEIFTTSDLQYMLNGTSPSGSPAIYANLGCVIPLNSLEEITGFRAEAYCAPDEVSFVATYYGC